MYPAVPPGDIGSRPAAPPAGPPQAAATASATRLQTHRRVRDLVPPNFGGSTTDGGAVVAEGLRSFEQHLGTVARANVHNGHTTHMQQSHGRPDLVVGEVSATDMVSDRASFRGRFHEKV